MLSKLGGEDEVRKEFFQSRVTDLAEMTISSAREQAKKDGWLDVLDGYTLIELANLINPPPAMDADGRTTSKRLSAKEVEERILENGKVLEAAVFGVEDNILGEAVKAIVVLKDDQSADTREIQMFCRAGLAEHKVPKIVEFMNALPKHKSGKVNKLLLKN